MGHGRLRESSKNQLRWPAVLTGFRRPAATVFVLASSSWLVACRRAAAVALASRRLEVLLAGRPLGRPQSVGLGSQLGPALVSLLTPAVLGVLKVRRAGLLSGMGLPWFTLPSVAWPAPPALGRSVARLPRTECFCSCYVIPALLDLCHSPVLTRLSISLRMKSSNSIWVSRYWYPVIGPQLFQ